MAKILTLKKRAEFLRLRGGQRWSTPNCVVETKPASPGLLEGSQVGSQARFGFTITKQVGPAVVRNKLRRRLRDIVGHLGDGVTRPGYDYVVVLRPAAAALSFQDLARDVGDAFARVHRASNQKRRK